MLRCARYAAALILLVLLTASAAPAEQKSYLDYVSDAVTCVEAGTYDKAVQSLDKAFALDANEPLAHTVLAAVFAHTGQVDAAIREYQAALSLQEGYPLAAYGLAVCDLAKGKLTEAQMLLSRISTPGGGVEDTAPARAYIDALKGTFASTDKIAADSTDPLVGELAALAMFKRGDPGKAGDAMRLVAMKNARPGYFEPIGGVATFQVNAAAKFTAPALKFRYAPPRLNDSRLPAISGTVTLRADLKKAFDVRYVRYFVDKQMVGLIDHAPYECEWNTLNVANGPHSIRIEGYSSQGLQLSEKSMKVRVANAKPIVHGAITGTQADGIASRIWECVRLKPSVAEAYLILGKIALAQGNKGEARDWFDKAMAVDPDFQDVRAQVIKLDGKTGGFREVWKVPAAGKVVALTFDDGPNAGTEKLLKILNDKGVRGTFFVVGSQAEAHPDVIKEMAAAGHDIENHTYSHRNLQAIPASEIEKEIFKGSAVIKDITGKRPLYMRCPHGRLNGTVGEVADRYGIKGIFWTVNTSKFEGSVPENMVNYVTAKAEDGAIVLMHNAEDITLMALPRIIDGLKARGYKFVTITDMLSRR